MKKLIVPFFVTCLFMSCNQEGKETTDQNMSYPAINVSYPETATQEVKDDYFGNEVADPFRWLEDDNAEDTKAWVTAQNDVTFDYLDKNSFSE